MNYPFLQPHYYYPYPLPPPPPPLYHAPNSPKTVYKAEDGQTDMGRKRKRGRPKLAGKDKSEKKKELSVKGHWDVGQNKRYHLFLQAHSNHFINKSLRRADKIFKSMAKFVGTRIAEQCRSHHQKMQKKYKNFYSLLRALRVEHFDSAAPSLVEAELHGQQFLKYDKVLSEEMLKCGEGQKGSVDLVEVQLEEMVKMEVKKEFKD